MSNRFQRRTARNTRQLVRLAAWQAERQHRADMVALAQLKLTVRAAIESSIPERPDRP